MRKNEIFAVYFAGLIQGITLVAFPAASTIFTSPSNFNFSSSAYGSLFVPQAALSIAASFFSSKFSQRFGIKTVFLIGLAANLISMSLLAASGAIMQNQHLSYLILLFATACLGLGFGLTVPTLNTLAAFFFPLKVDAAILILNALLGLGTALAPVFIAVFIGIGFWWGLPLLLVALLFFLLAYSFSLPLIGPKFSTQLNDKVSIPRRFWIFAIFAMLYGMLETINGNWASLYMKEHVGAATYLASLALTAFWSMVTVGRVFFASIEKFFPERWTFQLLPFVIMAAFILISFVDQGHAYLGILTFGFAGVGCSALLPLTISFGNKQLPSIPTFVAGGIIAFYLVGYGIAAFGVGSLQDLAGLKLNFIFGICAGLCVFLIILSYVINKEDLWTLKGK